MDLQDFRAQIDRVDAEILRLFIERIDISVQIAHYKKARGLPALDPARERDKLARIGEMAGEEIRPYADRLFALLFELSRAHQDGILNVE